MMEKCNKNCFALCDFCKHYSYNGEDLVQDGKLFKRAIYTGNGHCNFHNTHKDHEER